MRSFGTDCSVAADMDVSIVKDDPPVGQYCHSCAVKIKDTDSGFKIPFISKPDEFRIEIEIRVYHVACTDLYFRSFNDEVDDMDDDIDD